MRFHENRQYSRGQDAPPRLVEAAAKGESFIVATAGKPLVKVVPIDAPAAPRRLGFMRGAFTVPEDFDTMDQEEIEKLFYGDE
jgi:antitoxin (DNA-binding transcriptional repressor) of toxin-antitoxin stability system